MEELKYSERRTSIRNLICWISASEILASLTDEELVIDCAKTDAADYLVVIEMMNRLYPGWEDIDAVLSDNQN